MSGIERIAAERQRQIDAEGWTAEHDDSHRAQQLARAASVYAMPNAFRAVTHLVGPQWEGGGKWVGTDWPWEPHWYKPKPTDRIAELAMAGALIAAEIDRLERKATP